MTGKKPEYRWNHGKGYQANKHFFHAILKYGWDNIAHEIGAQNLSKEQAGELEQLLIFKYQTTNPSNGYNNSVGGESGGLGFKWTPEQLARRKATRIYTSSWAKGQHFSEEHRRKLGDAHRGTTHSEESKKKMSESHKGIVPAWAGKRRDDAYRASKSKPVICVETDIRYFGLMEAERQTGVHHGNISRCLKGRTEKAGGYHWRYADENQNHI